jgi:hypothetical protein
MANSYWRFSEMIAGITPEEEKWIRDVLSLDPDEGDEEAEQLMKLMSLEGDVDLDGWPNFEWRLRDGELWLHSEEGFTEDHLCWFVRELICRFRPEFVFSVSGSASCSKPRIGEFGGWWLVISKDGVKGGNTWDAAHKDAQEAGLGVDDFEKVRPHLQHLNYLEVAWYGDHDSVVVECTKCGEVVHELYNKSQDAKLKQRPEG